MPRTDPATDDGLEALREERAFLLRSLADLDAEHEAGDIDDDDYQSLTDDYTARAASVLRAIRAIEGPARRPPGRTATGRTPSGTAAVPAGPPASGRAATSRTATGRTATAREPANGAGAAGRALSGRARAAGSETEQDLDSRDRFEGGPASDPAARLASALASRRRWRAIAAVTAVLAFAAVAAWAVSRSSGSRLPGQTMSGNSQLTTGSTVSGGIDQRLIDAANLVNQGKVADALKLYDAVVKDDPNQPVALADGGWLEAQAGLAANRSDLVDTGLAKIEKAEKIDPTFADAHFFRGFLLLRAKNDPAGAVTELRLYLGSVDPTAPQVKSVQALLAEAIKAAGPNVPSRPNAATTTTPAP